MIKIQPLVLILLALPLMSCNGQLATPIVASVSVTPTSASASVSTPAPTPAPAEATAAPTETPIAESAAPPQLPASFPRPVTATLKSPTNAYEATLINQLGESETSIALTIDRALGGDKWTVLKEKQKSAGAALALVPMGWSSDERYFYYVRAQAGAKNGPGCQAFLGSAELDQANIAAKKVRAFQYDSAGPMALSADTKTLAQVVYEVQQPAKPSTRRRATATPTPNPAADSTGPKTTVKLVLRDVGGRRERSVVLAPNSNADAFQAGNIVWKPDGSALMLTFAHNPCSADARYSIVEVDAQSLSLRVVIDKDARLFTSQVWAEGGWVELLDRQGQRWLLDPSNGTVAKAS